MLKAHQTQIGADLTLDRAQDCLPTMSTNFPDIADPDVIDPNAIDKAQRESSTVFAPKFDASGLLSCIVIDAADKTVLMLAHMNADSLRMTLETGEVHFWSRSRQSLWKKGETSGNRLMLQRLLTDCDQDALVAEVTMTGDQVACHTGRRSCFYREVSADGKNVSLKFTAE
jgi:phosphoribosyl-AMP cyclohydrolase